MLSSTFLGYCNTIASVVDKIIGLFSAVFMLLNLNLPSVQAICTTIFGAS